MSDLPAGKLVRDRIPEIVRASGRQPEVLVLTPEQRLGALHDKLLEEAAELRAASPDEVLGELADVHEVLLALARVHGLTPSDIERAAAEKRSARGGFNGGLFLRTGG